MDEEKGNKQCAVCGSKQGKIHWSSAAQQFLCNKHRSQFNRCGKFLGRTKRDKNIIIDCGDYAEIVFENQDGAPIGKALIDAEDVAKCAPYKWYPTEVMGYTQYVKAVVNGVTTGLHRYILNAPPGSVVDHINRNGLDNRKKNLRFVTPSENSVNTRTRSASGEKNIYCKNGKYQVQIIRNYKTVYIATFDTLAAAVLARDAFIADYNLANNRKV